MPNLNASKKSLRADKRKTVFNKRKKDLMKKAVKVVRDFTVAGDLKEAQKNLPAAYEAIDKATKRNIIKKNTAARKKSRLVGAIKRAQG